MYARGQKRLCIMKSGMGASIAIRAPQSVRLSVPCWPRHGGAQSHNSRRLSLPCVVIACLSLVSSAAAQCGGWTPGFASIGTNQNVTTMLDDGAGSLYVCGPFTLIGGAAIN